MRRRSAEHDLPDGVVDGDIVAAAVMAEYFRTRARRRGARAGTERPADAATRECLLERARSGDAAAAEQLWARYRLRLIPPPR